MKIKTNQEVNLDAIIEFAKSKNIDIEDVEFLKHFLGLNRPLKMLRLITNFNSEVGIK